MTIVQFVRPGALGMRRHVAQISRGLRRLGHAVLIAGAVDPAWADDLHREGIACAPLPLGPRPGPADLRTARLLRAAANTADFVHAHGVRAGMIAMLSGLPFAYTLYAFPRAGLARQVERRLLRRARLVIALTPSLAAYARSAGAAEGQVRVVPRSIQDLSAGQAPCTLFSESARPRIGCITRLSREAGVDLLLEATRELLPAHPALELRIVGDGPDASALHGLAARLGLLGHVHFIRNLADPGPFLASLQIYVQPARREGQGLYAAQSLTSGCRVVAARTGVLREQLAGLAEFHAPGDSRSLAQAMGRAMREPQPSGAVEIALARFGPERQLSATLAAYLGAFADV